MAINALLFDIDGTLVDSNEQHVLAWEAAFRSVGIEFDRHVIHDQIGKGSDMLVQALLPDADNAVQMELGERQAEVFKSKFLRIVRPFPGARDLLVRAHEAGQDVVLATSASKDELEHYLDLLGVRDLITATVRLGRDPKHLLLRRKRLGYVAMHAGLLALAAILALIGFVARQLRSPPIAAALAFASLNAFAYQGLTRLL